MVKVWAVGTLLIYCAAKVHTWMTIGSPGFVARHWPFWAAQAGWALLIMVGGQALTAFGKDDEPTENR